MFQQVIDIFSTQGSYRVHPKGYLFQAWHMGVQVGHFGKILLPTMQHMISTNIPFPFLACTYCKTQFNIHVKTKCNQFATSNNSFLVGAHKCDMMLKGKFYHSLLFSQAASRATFLSNLCASLLTQVVFLFLILPICTTPIPCQVAHIQLQNQRYVHKVYKSFKKQVIVCVCKHKHMYVCPKSQYNLYITFH